jgi:hypothetical protein
MKAKEIREEIRTIWPTVGFIWTPDVEYIVPDIDDVIKALEPSGIKDIFYKGVVWECDKSALAANHWIKKHCLEIGLDKQWAFGECFASKLNGNELAHTLNICRATDGIYLIEPKGYFFRRASSDKDTVHIVRM